MASYEVSIRQQFRRLPLFLQVFGLASAAMLIPAGYGFAVHQSSVARAFFYPALIGLTIYIMIALARGGRPAGQGALGPLLSLFSTFVFLPLFLALPVLEARPSTGVLNAYFEMVSALTTTGATIFDLPESISPVLHLWRGLVAWLGGLLMWVAAVAILAPLHLGGFEVTAQAEPGRQIDRSRDFGASALAARLSRALRTLAPIYISLTVVLWVLLVVDGERSWVALIHASSVMSTSGISPVDGIGAAHTSIAGEAIMAMFMLFALSRLTFTQDTVTATQGGLLTDPEFRVGLLMVITVPVFLFARHWISSLDDYVPVTFSDAILGFWGSIFTAMSFLTTTGFVSEHWVETQNWSRLHSPGMILMGLALMGGGVATTAGGVKLLRVFALYRNGTREMEQLVFPNSVSGAGVQGRRLQSNGAFIAWIFFMLFALSLAATTLALTLTGVGFSEAMVLSISSLTTTGPLAEHGLTEPVIVAELPAVARGILCGAMVIGRLETLAIIALLTPDLWRA